MKYFLFCCALIVSVVCDVPPECLRPPNNKNPAECCERPDLISDEAFTKCAKDLIGREVTADELKSISLPPQQAMCIAECVLTSAGISVNDDFDVAAAQAKMTEKAEEDWKPVIRDGIGQCAKIYKDQHHNMKQNLQAPASGQKQCSPIGVFAMTCMNQQLFQNCPQSKRKSNPECDALKAFAEKCHLPPM